MVDVTNLLVHITADPEQLLYPCYTAAVTVTNRQPVLTVIINEIIWDPLQQFFGTWELSTFHIYFKHNQ